MLAEGARLLRNWAAHDMVAVGSTREIRDYLEREFGTTIENTGRGIALRRKSHSAAIVEKDWTLRLTDETPSRPGDREKRPMLRLTDEIPSNRRRAPRETTREPRK